MQHRKLSIALAGIMLAVASFTANADILFQNLGTSAPPATVGSHSMTPFDQAAQAAIPFDTAVTTIPGSPVPGDLLTSFPANRRAVGIGWATAWSHGYTGPIFFVQSNTTTLTLPPNTQAFSFYIEGNTYGTNTFTITTNSGATSGPVQSYTGGNNGAAGFAVYTTAGETISTITISNIGDVPYREFSIGEFSISAGPSTTCASEGYTGTKLEWCKNICEREYSGATLNMWIRRWIDRYRQLPYCAVSPPPAT